MVQNWTTRTELLLGQEKLERLQNSHVLIIGLGGVGAYAAEMLCRSGIQTLSIVDGDSVNESNLNRQLVALRSTIGKDKTEVLASRLQDINPEVKLHIYKEFLKEERTLEVLEAFQYDYVIDAIDTLTPKTFLVYNAIQKGYRVISSMGAGAKIDPSKIQVSDISKSFNCKLAKMLRKRLHRLDIRKGLKVVFSSELPNKDAMFLTDDEQNKKSVVGTISYMPSIFGCMLASEVIRDLTAGEIAN